MMHVISDDCGFGAPGIFEVSWKRWSLALSVIYSGADGDDRWPWMLHVHFLLLNLFIHLPLQFAPPSKKERWERDWQQWGFSFVSDSIHFHWNEAFKSWSFPWFSKIHQRHEVLCADGSWVPFIGSWERDKGRDGREEFVFPYEYKLKRGEVQQRTAVVYVERHSWRPKWFQWSRLFEQTRQSLSVEFSDEVGERSGSWKGGCIGCGYNMLPRESAEQTLRRMERERTFN